ncbi:MAG TPA: Ig-like domain-containing protein, partial [Gemmatimonadales bacterium]
MTFKHKLSRRLALLKDRWALLSVTTCAAALAVWACARPVTDPQAPSSPVVRIVTLPDSVTLNPGDTRQFVAYGRTEAGDSVPVAVGWSASGGTITGGGLYTADTVAGSYAVTATATSPSTAVSSSSLVKNTGSVSQIVLNPTTAFAVVGGTVQFTSYGKKKNGDSVAVPVVYTATGGSVSATGLYTAGTSAGSYSVIATQSRGTLADTALVSISAVPVASVTVSPAVASLTAGQTVQLAAVTRDSAGNVLTGRTVTWTTTNSGVATVSATGLVAGVAAGPATVTATSESKSSTALLTVTAPVSNPGTVTDLSEVGVSDTGVTLAFTEVDDGTGQPASYDVRYAVGTLVWGPTAPSVTRGTCTTPLAGT